MKIIFLGIDGVLNSNSTPPANSRSGIQIDPSRLDLIKNIVDSTGAKIVLSSSWREHWEKDPDKCDDTGAEINEIFAAKGLSVFDKTANVDNDRTEEITEWLKRHPDITDYVVLDDGWIDEKKLNNRVVKTSRFRNGIDESDAEKAIAILN